MAPLYKAAMAIRAVLHLVTDNERSASERAARVALQAIREPSEAMIKAANESDYSNIEGCSLEQLELDIRIPWRAMIDAALAEGE